MTPAPWYIVGPILELLIAGMAMSVGARTAGGCTSGHGLTGMSLGRPASIVATAVALVHLLMWL